MRKVLITSAGSTTAISIAKSLRLSGQSYKLFGTDIFPYDKTPGTPFFHSIYRVPPYSERPYVSRILSVIRKEKIQYVFPVVDGEVEILSLNRKKIESAGAKLIASDHAVVAICNDKYKTWKYLDKHGVKTPRIYLANERKNISCTQHNPYFIKPRYGLSSVDCYTVCSRKELDVFCKRIQSPIIQKKMYGKMYVVDLILDKRLNPVAIATREEIASKAGVGVKAVSVSNPNVTASAVKIAQTLGCTGPINIEFFKKKTTHAQMIEVNPRPSAGVILSTYSGVNIPHVAILIADNGTQPLQPKPRQTNQISMNRYWNEVYVVKSHARVQTYDTRG